MKSITVVPYNPDWPQLFEREAKEITRALGGNCLQVHHVGSTAVPGLAAKPKIDIIGVVKDPDQAIVNLEAAGFDYRGEWNIPFKFNFTKRGELEVNLHVFEADHPEIELNLLFRDYLRAHPLALAEYAALKAVLLNQKESFEKNNPLFTGYTLGKDAFIRQVLQKAGFNRLRLLKCTHHLEWQAAKEFRQKYFFDKVPVDDPYTWTFNHNDHVHLVLCQGTHVVGYAHLQLWPHQRAAMRIIVIDEPFRNQGFGRHFLTLCEEWLNRQGYQSLHVESSPLAYAFYKKHNYQTMPFEDPDGYESDPQDIAIGKIL
ncbi:bifunctional GrpB family protein/GNAT family N-acetyltransferase [Candidatus Finniella inopinata]|uniref:GNAT family N-acetyltransferase n=1 Tax=Candidatus Finniella inopinata TaxID=1696036 RepID=A0A4Q7DKU1_9PROT|nr:bifunctional GrpB family protein/GNAT family N-acetyltransferase [Candidatus Finniella inopinata]RZI46949.1 GNAT family N-acetyltransferase [Candidatus Finniella inopinata]